MQRAHTAHERMPAEVESVAEPRKSRLAAAPTSSNTFMNFYPPWRIVVEMKKVVVEHRDIVDVALKLASEIGTHELQHLPANDWTKRPVSESIMTFRWK